MVKKERKEKEEIVRRASTCRNPQTIDLGEKGQYSIGPRHKKLGKRKGRNSIR